MQVADDHAAVFLIDPAKRLHDNLCIQRIKRGNRLISKDNLRVLHQSAGDGDALLLPAGQRLGAFRRMLDNVEPVQNLDGLGDIFPREKRQHGYKRRLPVKRAEQYVCHDIDPRHQVELLEDHRTSRLPAAPVAAAKRGDILIIVGNLAVCWVGEPVHQAKQGRFSRA